MHFLIPAEEPNALERYLLLIVDDREILFAWCRARVMASDENNVTTFVKFFTEFFYHDVALAKITQKHHDLFMEDEEIKSLLMKLRY